MSIHKFKFWLEELQIGNAQEKAGLLQKFKLEFIKENQKINLTSPKGLEDFDNIHILDSLSLLPYLEPELAIEKAENKTILDLGTGGGLPGIPLAIALPQHHFILIDAVTKKIQFVQRTIESLKLSNLEAFATRIESWRNDKSLHEKADIIISRAFGDMDLIIDLTFPLLKKNGCYFLFRGPQAPLEDKFLTDYLLKFGGEIVEIYRSEYTKILGNRLIYKINPGLNRNFSPKTFASLKKESIFRHKNINK